MKKDRYWMTTAGLKSFAVWKTSENGMTFRVGIYRSYDKAQRVLLSLENPTPHIEP